MSGIEIISFILAGLPLAISAIEHYRDGLDPLKDYFRYDSTLKSLRTRLRIQQDLFEGTLHRLLLDYLTEPEARALFPDSDQAIDKMMWGSPEIEEKLCRRLGSKYKTFMDVVKEMEVVMRRLMKKLDIDMHAKPAWNLDSPSQTIERGKWEWRKIRRSFGRKDREALIQDFERYNGDIGRYVEQREILAPPSRSRPEEFSNYYHVVRDNACGLYGALEAGWNCQCSCPHIANLRLEQRSDANARQGFKLSLSFLHRPSQDVPGQRAWLEAQVDMNKLEEDTEFVEQFHENTSKALPLPPLSESAVPLGNNITATKVSLSLPSKKANRQSVTIVEPTQATLGPSSRFSKKQNISRISSLCEAIQAARNPHTHLGSLADFSHQRCIDITTTALVPSRVAEPVPLDALLSSGDAPYQRSKASGRLSRQQRLSIAVTLAHAVLQLHTSPWLDETWSKSDIFFFTHGSDSGKRPVIDHPYVSRSFMSAAESSQKGHILASSSNDFFSNQIINKSLFALGIVLIELCFNRAFEGLCADARNSDAIPNEEPLNTAEIYKVATSLIDDVYNEQGTQYGYVVQRCLKCEFGVQDSKKQLDFDTFRALTYEGVLAPLEENLKRYSL